MVAEEKNLLSKFKFTSKFSGLSLGTPERDGSTEDDTLIHNALVGYYNTRQEPYPDWLGVKNSAGVAQRPPVSASSSRSGFQPVYRQQLQQGSDLLRFLTTLSGVAPDLTQARGASPDAGSGGYQPRSSRLQDMYNKSRQQLLPGSGYSSQPSFLRANSASGPSRLREKMLQHGGSYSGSYGNGAGTGTGGTGATRGSWGR